jgi:hypothetical protein
MGAFPKQGDELVDDLGRDPELVLKDPPDLNEKVLGSDKVMTGEGLPEDIGAEASRGHRRDDNVGVEEDPHEILAKISSSVR